MCEIENFVNILKPRKAQFGIITFMSRSWNPTKTVNLEKSYKPQDLKHVVADSMYIDSIIEAESVKRNIPKKKLKKIVVKFLDEMAMDKKMHVIRWMGIAFLNICSMMRIGVFVNETAILKIKSSMGKNPVLFLPTHRSYADFCLMTYLCYHYDIDLPAVAAGMDFYSMMVVGQSMRETGAFYIRRTLSGDALYAGVLRQYVRTLVAKHHSPVEFFIEGTRSRSNKSLAPKFGLLTMALLPYFTREVQDITVVPVNISYERLMEQELFTYEHLGVPKPRESTGGLLRSLHRLNDHYGNIYVNLGEPVSVKEFMDDLEKDKQIKKGYKDYGIPTFEMLKPLDLRQLTEDQNDFCQSFACHVVSLQQKCTVVTITNLLATVLMESFMNNEAPDQTEVLKAIEWLIPVLKLRKASVVDDDIKSSLDRILIVHKRLIKRDKQNKLRLVAGNPVAISKVQQYKMKGYVLKAQTMVVALPVIQLQLYVNPLLFHLGAPALVLLAAAPQPDIIDVLFKDYFTLRSLLSFEHFHPPSSSEEVFRHAYEFCLNNDVITPQFRPGNNGRLRRLLQHLVTAPVCTLAACVEVMLKGTRYEHSEVVKLVQEEVESKNYFPYCLSLEMIENCLNGLCVLGAIKPAYHQQRHQERIYTSVPKTLKIYEQFLKKMMPDYRVDYANTNAIFAGNYQPIAAKL